MAKIALFDHPPNLEIVKNVTSIGTGKDDFHGTANNWIVKNYYSEGDQFNYSGDFVEFLKWALEIGINVIGVSWSLDETSERNIALQKVLDAGVIVVASAGNRGSSDPQLSWPGRDPRVICCANWDIYKNALAQDSSWGANVYVAAQGHWQIPNINGDPVDISGTSEAVPVIVAAAGEWLDITHGSREQFMEWLKNSVKDVLAPGRDNATGWGLFTWDEELFKAVVPVYEEQKKFIASITEQALNSQLKTGVPAAVIIAQACQETGYGKDICKDIATGKNSLSLFNIKGTGPNGFVQCWTHEEVNGQSVRVKAKFRAYHNYEESFTDHANLLASDYQNAMAVKDDPIKFAKALIAIPNHKYATDPTYADDLIWIMEKFGLLNLKPKAKEVEPDMSPQDAQKIVDILGVCWTNRDRLGLAASKEEIHRLADEVRKAGGLPVK